LVILSISFIVLLAWQVSNFSTQRKMLQTNIDSQQQAVAQSDQVQASLVKLASDLLQTAQTDDVAKAIATKYGIQQNGTAAAPAK
jgi:hypothetical protein